MAFLDRGGVLNLPAVLELNRNRTIFALFGNAFVNDDFNFLECLLNLGVLRLGIVKARSLQVSLQERERAHVVDGKFSLQAGLDGRAIMTFVAQWIHAQLHSGNLVGADFVLPHQVEGRVGGEELRRAAGMQLEREPGSVQVKRVSDPLEYFFVIASAFAEK